MLVMKTVQNRLGNDTAIVRNPTIVQNRYDRGAIGYARPETRADARGCNERPALLAQAGRYAAGEPEYYSGFTFSALGPVGPLPRANDTRCLSRKSSNRVPKQPD